MLEKFVNENATVMTEYTFKTVETEGDQPKGVKLVRFKVDEDKASNTKPPLMKRRTSVQSNKTEKEIHQKLFEEVTLDALDEMKTIKTEDEISVGISRHERETSFIDDHIV